MLFMKKGSKILALGILGLFLISFLAGVVSAETVLDSLLNKVGLGSTTTDLDFANSPGFAKFLIFVLIALIVYGLGEFLPFLGDKPVINGAVAIIIGILSSLYLSKEEIYTAILSYSSLGITLTLIIPFMIIGVISFKSFNKGHVFLSKFVWVAYLIVLIARYLFGDTTELGSFGLWTYLVLGIAALLMFVFEYPLYQVISTQKLKADEEKFSKLNKTERVAKAAQLLELATAYEKIGDKEHAEELLQAASRLEKI